MNYLVLGHSPNAGDVGIGAAVLQGIQEADPDASIVCLADRPDAFRGLPELRGHVVEPFYDLGTDRSTRAGARLRRDAGYAARIMALRWRPSLLFRRDPEVRRIAEHHRWADFVVHQGGPGWNDWVLRKANVRKKLAYMSLARHYDVSVILYAQSFGPFAWNGPGGRLKRMLAKRMLDNVRLLTVRDGYSRPALERLGVSGPRIVEAADAAWNLTPASDDGARERYRRFGVPDGERPRIGLTLRSFHGGYGISEVDEDRLIGEFAAFCDAVIDDIGELVFLSTDYRRHGRRNDLDVMRLVQERMRSASRVHVIDETLPPAELKSMYARMDALVSVRLHPAIFAMAEGVPAILVGYDPKSAGVAEQMGMQRWHMDVRGFTAAAGIELLNAMLAQRPAITKLTRERARELKRTAGRSSEAIRELVRTQNLTL